MTPRDVAKPDLSILTPGQRAALRTALDVQRDQVSEVGWIGYLNNYSADAFTVMDGHHQLVAALDRLESDAG